MTIWHMRIACGITKVTHTHTEYAIHITFPLQQWLQERASISCLIVVDIDEAVNNISVQYCHGKSTMGSLCTVF